LLAVSIEVELDVSEETKSKEYWSFKSA